MTEAQVVALERGKAQQDFEAFFDYYNHDRLHQSFGYQEKNVFKRFYVPSYALSVGKQQKMASGTIPAYFRGVSVGVFFCLPIGSFFAGVSGPFLCKHRLPVSYVRFHKLKTHVNELTHTNTIPRKYQI